VGRTEINAQGQNDRCYVSESLLGKLTGGTENLPIYRGSVNLAGIDETIEIIIPENGKIEVLNDE
jgi:hypothetical protein